MSGDDHEREGGAARMRARLRSGSEGAEARLERGLGAPALFAIAAGAVGSSLYFALGIVAQDALALTPVAFAAAGLFFLLTMLSYLEGSSLHTERGGASMFARYAFNELWSFVAGWAILLDFMIVMALGSLAVSGYLGVFWHVPSEAGFELVVAAAVLAWVVWSNIRGQTVERYRRVLWVVLVTAALAAGIIVVGLFQFQDYDALLDSVDLGVTPTWGHLALGAIVAGVALTGIESASGLAGELKVGRRGLRRVGAVAAVGLLVLYVGMALVAVLALPVQHGASALSDRVRRGADRRGRRPVRPRLVRRDDALRDRRCRGRRAPAGGQRPDAGNRAARLLARDEPPDTEPGRPARRDARHAVRGDRDRRRDRVRAQLLGGRRVAGGDLCLRRDAGVHARAPVGGRVALPRAGPQAGVPGAAQHPRRRRGPSAAERVRGGRRRRVVGDGRRAARGSALRRRWLAARRPGDVRDLPQGSGEVADAALHDPRRRR